MAFGSFGFFVFLPSTLSSPLAAAPPTPLLLPRNWPLALTKAEDDEEEEEASPSSLGERRVLNAFRSILSYSYLKLINFLVYFRQTTGIDDDDDDARNKKERVEEGRREEGSRRVGHKNVRVQSVLDLSVGYLSISSVSF